MYRHHPTLPHLSPPTPPWSHTLQYARGWLNLGIAHANLMNYGEAARCYLSALRLNGEATHIWSYLRISLSCMERFDLASKTEEMNVDAFAGDFDIPF